MTLSSEAISAKTIPMGQIPILPSPSSHPFENFSSLAIPQPIPIKHRKKFSAEEDEILSEMVEKFGPKKWNRIAQYLPFRTARQCRDRYCNYLAPGFFNGEWLQEEDDLLYEKYKEIGPKWAQMKAFFKNRSPNSLKNRWNYFVSKMHPQVEPPSKSPDESQEHSPKETIDEEEDKENSPKGNESPSENLLEKPPDATTIASDDKNSSINEKEKNSQDSFKIYYDIYINPQNFNFGFLSNSITDFRRTGLNETDLEEIYSFPSLSQGPLIPLHAGEPETYDLGGLSFDIGSPIPF